MLAFGGFALISLGMMLPDLSSLEYCGGVTAAGTPTAITLSNIPARDVLVLMARVPSLSASDSIAFQFNGDTAANYWARIFTSADVIGQATFSNLEAVSKTSIQIDNVPGTITRHALAIVQNRLATTKVLSGQTASDSGSSTTVSTAQIAGGEWINTTAQITSITLTTVGGTATFGAGSGFGVFGRNIK